MQSRKAKEPKRKPKYGMFSCVGYMYKMMWTHERSQALACTLTVPISVSMSALALYTPSAILRSLETSDSFTSISLVIIGLMLANLLFDLANSIVGTKKNMTQHYLSLQMIYHQAVRRRDMDMFRYLDPEVHLIEKRAKQAINGNTTAVNFPLIFADMTATILNFFLFGSVITLLNPWIILLLAVGCIVNFSLSRWQRRRDYETRDDRNILSKKLNYIAGYISGNFQYGKDIRLYHFSDYLTLLIKKLFKQSKAETEKVERRSFLVEFISFVVILLRDGAAYAFLISKAVRGEVDTAQFVTYFSAIAKMSDFMSDILGSWSNIYNGALRVSDYREYFDIPDWLNRGKGIPLPKGAFSIEFKHVTFRYPTGEKNVLEDLNFKIEPGEKLALVGTNGAGKTTLTKLMCGLLLPTEGTVLIDGHPLQEYNRDEMYTLFGLVPQNYSLLPISIAHNIACTDEESKIDRQKLEECIRLAGLEEKIASLPLGMDTPLNRQINPDGITLSGGESQKLLLARLLYRSPKCVILDEPTAALDPIAEDKMYRSYNEIIEGSTSVFISHRLASTRFCDRIFLLDGARFAETGTHEELMAAGKKYRELFDIQSKYYKEEG